MQRPTALQQEEIFNKVAAITLLFWILKIVATTLGEMFGDFLSMSLELGYLTSLGITFAFLVVALVLQLSQKKYVPAIYWLTIVSTTTLGTEISDFMDRSLHLGYALGSLVLVILLLLSLLIWYRKYKNLEVYPISDRTKEAIYWSAILFSNSLGTAFGDFLSDNLGLGYLTGAAITAGIIVLVVLLHYLTKINEVILFWIAFVFTRPFGATFGDFLTKPFKNGGLNFSRGAASLIAAGLMALILWVSSRKNEVVVQGS